VGPLRIRSALHACGTHFADPPGTIAAVLAWYLEERDPAVLDAPTFLVRADGLARTRAASPVSVRDAAVHPGGEPR
jgi:hypothetical protein